MTRFEELTDIIDSNQNKNKHKKKSDVELEVSGLSSSDIPLGAWGNQDIDPDMIEMLYRNNLSRPNRGENTSNWESL